MMNTLTILFVLGFLVPNEDAPDKPDSNLTTHGVRPSTIKLEPCKNPGTEDWGLCGTYDVYENRESMQGRTIAMKVVVYPAKGQETKPDPLFIFVGGPGQGAASVAGFLVSDMDDVRAQRDVVLIDQRGTGDSNQLRCKFLGPENSLQTYLTDMFPVDYVEACRKDLETRADLTKYTSDIAMDDIDEIRAALGYDKINISGGSYGTRACMVYMRRHGESVRTASLLGTAPVFMAMPGTFAEETEAALQRVIGDCEKDEPCNNAFPKFRDNLETLHKRLLQGPIETEVINPMTKEKEKISFGLGPFLTIVRAMLYGVRASTELPLVIEQASKGDFNRLAVYAAMYAKGINEGLAEGMYLSITCAEDIPYFDYKASEERAKGTLLGDYRIFQQRRACEYWPRAEISEGYRDPVKSSIPTLLLSGEVDPVTPPHWGEEVARHLTNSLHVSVPNAAHSLGLSDEHGLNELMLKFLETASVEDLDPSPLKQVKRPPFVIDEKEARKLD